MLKDKRSQQKHNVTPAKAGVSFVFFAAFFIPLAILTIWPRTDLTISGQFYTPGEGFTLATNPFLLGMHWFASRGSWVIGGVLGLATIVALLRHKPLLCLDAKAWLFLLLALVIGPGLIVNQGFKNHWGRARPYQVTEFGGDRAFTPALVPQPDEAGHGNGSFVAGDAGFGFFLPSFAYVVPENSRRTRKRLFFWTGMAGSVAFSLMRLVMGAHFPSDILFAAILVLAMAALLHGVMYGFRLTAAEWRGWLLIPARKYG